MKIILTFLTIALFSFGANAESKKVPHLKDFKLDHSTILKKFSLDRCSKIFNQSKLIYENMERASQNGNFNDIEIFKKNLVDNSIIFNAFCKD